MKRLFFLFSLIFVGCGYSDNSSLPKEDDKDGKKKTYYLVLGDQRIGRLIVCR